jgi:hypothetical protein
MCCCNFVLLSRVRFPTIPLLLWRIPASVVPFFHAAVPQNRFGDQTEWQAEVRLRAG